MSRRSWVQSPVWSLFCALTPCALQGVAPSSGLTASYSNLHHLNLPSEGFSKIANIQHLCDNKAEWCSQIATSLEERMLGHVRLAGA